MGVLMRPLGLPFMIYAFLAEFDHLFPPGPLGTTAKASGFLVIVWLMVNLIRKRFLIKPGREVIGWLLFIAWLTISLIWSDEPGDGMREIQQYIGLFVLYALIAVSSNDENDMRIVTLSMILAAVAAALFSLTSYNSHLAMSSSARFRATLFNGTMNNYIDPNHLAASFQLPFAILLIMMFREPRFFLKLTYLLGCTILAAGMLTTGSRAGAIGAAIIMLFFLFRSRYRAQISIIGILAVSLSLLIPTVWTRFGDQTSSVLGGRLPIWRVAFAAFKDHWVIGHGAGSFRSAYELSLLKAFQPPSFFYQSMNSHDIFLYAAVELGIIGVALLAAAWWLQLRALRMIPPGDQLYDLRIAIEAGTLTLLVEACTLDLLTFKYLWVAFSLTALVRSVWFGARIRSAAPKRTGRRIINPARSVEAARAV
jgi:O-antigen ligase